MSDTEQISWRVENAANIRVKKTDPDAQLPERQNALDAGFDLRSIEDVSFNPGETKLVDTGLEVAIPPGYEMQIRDRSSVALEGLVIPNSPGTVDAGYRGPVKVMLHYLEGQFEWMKVEKGDRIAQAVIQELPEVQYTEVETLPPAPERNGGFGSTGR